MKTFIATIILMLGALCLQVEQPGATILTIGDAFNSGSWSQRFQLKDIGTFDRIESFVQTGNSFKSGIENFDKPDWQASVVRPDYTKAIGSIVGGLTFDFHFDGLHNDNIGVVHTNPVELVILAWCGADIKEDIHALYDGCRWTFEDHHNWDCGGNSSAPVPEPGTLVLLGAGILGLGIYSRRRMNK